MSTLLLKADIEKWKNKERLRKKMRQQTDETQRQLEIETTKEQNATARYHTLCARQFLCIKCEFMLNQKSQRCSLFELSWWQKLPRE